MSAEKKPRIGVIGTGAIGGFYGLMLARAGFDVHFLLRSEYQAVAEQGLVINSAVHGELRLEKVQAYQDVAQMPPCDWLLVGAKTTSNQALAPLINQLAAPGAKVLLLQNGYGVEQDIKPYLDPELHVLGGLCFICVHRQAPGVVEHQAQGMINIGYYSTEALTEAQLAVAKELAQAFTQAGVPSNAVPDLEHARWHKLIWNMPFNGLSVVLKSGTQALLAQESAKTLLKDLMEEVVLGARACGHEMPAQMVDMLLLGTTKLGDYLPSMYHDFIHQRPMELAYMYAKPLAAARAAGQALPKLEMLYQQLQFLDQPSS